MQAADKPEWDVKIWRIVSASFLCMLLLALLGGCAVKPLDTLRRERFEQLPQKYSQFDFRLAWNTRVTDNGVAVEGVIWNIRWAHAENLEVWVSLLDSDGRVQAKEVDLIMPSPLKIGEKSGFSVNLPARPVPGSKLMFTYSYYAVEDSEFSSFWTQSFEAKL